MVTLDAYKADVGHNEFAASSNLTSEAANAEGSNKHRRTVFKMLAPVAYEQQQSGASASPDNNAANGASSTQRGTNTQPLEEAATRAQANANAADAELKQAHRRMRKKPAKML